MCFTISINLTKKQIEQRRNARFDDAVYFEPNYHVSAFETPEVPVICSEETGKIKMFNWGFIPSWTKDLDYANKIRFQTLNARAETILEKPSFKKSANSKRCLVVASGFFDWQHFGKEKYPYYISLKDDDFMIFAGIYDNWHDTTSGKDFNTFSIITTKANPLMEKIHNVKKRMPVILSKDDEDKWLDINAPVSEILKPYDESKMNAYTVSKLLSKHGIDKNIPDIIKEYNYNQTGLFNEGF